MHAGLFTSVISGGWMSDRAKIIIALVLFVAALLLPLLSFLLGWYYADVGTGLIIAAIAFVILFAAAFLFLIRIRDLTVFSSSLPYLFGTLYAILPDAIIGPFDDASVLGVGMVLSYILEIRRNPSAPKWAIVFPLIALIYMLVGGLFPGPVDEFIIGGLLYLAYLATNAYKERALPERSGHLEK